MLNKVFILSALVLCANAQLDEAHPAPEPYSFTYESPNEDGTSSARSETGDANGNIVGFYIIKGADGQDRRVDYTAGPDGFNAEVSTNEIGTETHEAANAIYRSSSPPVAELIASWSASGEGKAAAARRAELAASGRLSISRGSILTSEIKPAISTAKFTETIRTSTSGGSQITPEGYVLVPASAARTAGIASIGPEISSLQGLGGIRTSSGGVRTTGTTRFTTTGGGTRFASGSLTGSSLFNVKPLRK